MVVNDRSEKKFHQNWLRTVFEQHAAAVANALHVKHGFKSWKDISGLEKEAKRNEQLLLQELEHEKTGGSKDGKRKKRKNKVADKNSSASAADDAGGADADDTADAHATRGALVEASAAAEKDEVDIYIS